VEEPPFLMPVDWIVGRIEIEDDLFGRLGERLEEHRRKQRFDRRPIMAHLMVFRRLGPSSSRLSERALAGERRAVFAMRRPHQPTLTRVTMDSGVK
jgi:hypothetical protein